MDTNTGTAIVAGVTDRYDALNVARNGTRVRSVDVISEGYREFPVSSTTAFMCQQMTRECHKKVISTLLETSKTKR